MKKIVKAVALSCLLAVLVSAVAVFAVGAAPAAKKNVETAVGYYNWDTEWKNESLKLANGGNATITQKTDSNGKTYYQIGYSGAYTGKGAYIGMGYEGSIPIRPNDRKDGAGNLVSGSDYEKNTDIMVIDFDMSTDSAYIDGMYLHTAWFGETWAHGGRYQNSEIYFTLNPTENSHITVGSDNDSTKVWGYESTEGNKWNHVSLVYDFRNADANKGTDVYIYINGVLSGVRADVTLQKAYQLHFIRLTIPNNDDLANGQPIGATSNFANFTIKGFGVGAFDKSDDLGNIGKAGVSLSDIEELKYCLENEMDTGKITKLADINLGTASERAVYSINELDGKLVNGDVVTLYKSVSRQILIPEGAKVTFKDESGTPVTPGTNTGKVSIAAPIEAPLSKMDLFVRDLANVNGSPLVYGGYPDGTEGVVGINTAYTQDTATLPSFNKNSADSGKLKYTAKTLSSTDTRGYWKLDYSPTNIANTGTAWHASPDITAYAIADTKYLVYDLDVSTDTTFPTLMYQNMQWKDSSGTRLGSRGNISVGLHGDGKLIGAGNDTATKFMQTAEDSKWTNVTFIYDFTAEDYKGYKLHIYIDGVYMGNAATGSENLFKGAATVNFYRYQFKHTTGAADASANFANITTTQFTKDYNGTAGASIGDPSVNLADIEDLKYCLENDYDNAPPTAGGEEEEPAEGIPLLDPTAAIAHSLKDKNTMVLLLKDSVYAPEAGSGQHYVNTVFDLGGKKLTVEGAPSGHTFQPNNTSVTVKNGSLVLAQTANNFAFLNSKSARVTFKNLTNLENKTTKYAIEARYGGIVIENCSNITASGDNFMSLRGGNGGSGVIMSNSTLTTPSTAFPFSTTSSSSKRYGSMDVYLNIQNSTVNAKNIISVSVYASQQGKVENGAFVPSAGHADNNNSANIVIKGSTFTATENFLTTIFADARNNKYDIDGDGNVDTLYPDNFTFVTNASIESSVITAENLVVQDFGADEKISDEDEVPTDLGYTYTVDMYVKGSTLNIADKQVKKERLATRDWITIIYADTTLSTFNKAEDGAKGVIVKGDDTLGQYIVERLTAGGEKYYISTDKVTVHYYKIGNDEYELLLHEDDAFTTDRIPVKLPTTGSQYLTYDWAEETDENGAYYLEMKVDVPLKANLSLYGTIDFNLYFPADLPEATYDTFTLNGQPVSLEKVTLGGIEYMAISVPDLTPISAGHDVTVEFELTDPTSGLSGKGKRQVSTLDYLKNVLKSTEKTDEEKKLIAAVVNYIAKAYDYKGLENADLAALLTLPEYTAITLAKTADVSAKNTIADVAAFSGVGFAIDDTMQLTFELKDTASGNIVLSYYKNGKKFTETIVVTPGATITLEFRACDLLEDITVRYRGVEGVYNLPAYFAAAGEALEGDAEKQAKLSALAEAMQIYSEVAKAYAGI